MGYILILILIVDMLAARKNADCKDLSDFDRGKSLMPRVDDWVRTSPNGSSYGMFLECSA